ncbi:hypothetical protein K4H28_01810 [Deefgea tanakiae]|uniref:DNA-binding protein n=1 Tax=Deefgea tanakiae TaxID=2865840 RepID=A0ABX8Z6H0_9NEIS|nr:hypothetical protein [Deefgea tanakiae]QZA78186.1 hypothetical protein K4H28_01810 [Deefgea tanakiae]
MEKTVLSTNEYAGVLGNKPQTILKGYCLHGHYLGVRPLKLPNGRLLWPRAEVEALLVGAEK